MARHSGLTPETLIMLDDALRQQSKAAKLKAFYEEK